MGRLHYTYRCYHRRGPIDFPLVKRMGRFTLTGNDIVKVCLDGASDPERAPFEVACLALQLANGRARVIPRDEAVDWVRAIQQGLRPTAVSGLPPPGARLREADAEPARDGRDVAPR